jgi:SAM-dependent MidA family methyltransferase
MLKKLIRQHGYISVEKFMQLALTHPQYGYYTTKKDVFGREGDFITAPEISQIFGEVIGSYFAYIWLEMGKPKLQIVELGGGQGTLMFDILNSTKNIADFHKNIEVHMVEVSEVLRKKQQEKLAGFAVPLFHHANLENVPQNKMFLVANEFLDALPVAQFIMHKGAWHERIINLDEQGNLQFSLGDEKKIVVDGQFSDGDIYEYSEAAVKIIQQVSERVAQQKGSALFIDYGYTRRDKAISSLQAVKNHKFHDVLQDVGKADLTCHVDFALLKYTALAIGATSAMIVNQGDFLRNLGIEKRAQVLMNNASDKQKEQLSTALRRLIDKDKMGELFKCLIIN